MRLRLRKTLLASLAALLFVCACAHASFAQDDDLDPDHADDPVRVFERGQDAHARGDLERALELYDAALKLRPEFAEAHYQKGVALVSLKKFAEAEAALRRAAELKKDWALPQAALGFLVLRGGRDREAEPYLRRAVELDPQNRQALVALAQIASRAKSNADALKFIRQATDLEGATAQDWALRAQSERFAGDKAAAASSVERALKIDPQLWEAHAERAEQRAAAGDLAGAAEDLKSAAAGAPESERQRLGARLGAFEAQRRIGDCSEGSVGALEEIVKTDAKNAPAHNCLGIAYRRSDPQKSLEHFRAALELQPSNANYATGYASALVQLKRFAEAVAVLRRVVAAKPDLFEAHANLATALDELRQYEEALAEFKWISEAKPDLAVAHFFLAHEYDSLGDCPNALAEYETFLAKADAAQNKLEIDKVNLRLPLLRDQIKRGACKKQTKPGR
ncbi:MAG: tetratricopeptide repeat protein [Pyrinomonadaceae bacterium]